MRRALVPKRNPDRHDDSFGPKKPTAMPLALQKAAARELRTRRAMMLVRGTTMARIQKRGPRPPLPPAGTITGITGAGVMGLR